eukprot:2885770-Prymnesium_polylepis.1
MSLRGHITIYHNTQNGMRVYLVNDTRTLPAIITNDDPVKPEAQLLSNRCSRKGTPATRSVPVLKV